MEVVCNTVSESVARGSETVPVTPLYYRRLSTWDHQKRRLLRLVDRDRIPIDKYNTQLRKAREGLVPVCERLKPEVAYIDFGRSAVILGPILAELGIPYVVHFHGSDITKHLSDPVYRRALHGVFASAAALVVASDYMRRLLVLEGAEEQKIRLVRLGVHLEGVEPLSWEERVREAPSVAFLGRFAAKKHPLALVEAFRLVHDTMPAARLSMVGDGEEMRRVRERVERYGLQEAVSLHGSLPRSHALAIVNRSWVYAQHSVTARDGDTEGFGVSLAEAARLGLPVVSTFHNGIPEQVIHDHTGYLVTEHDFETMASYIEKLLRSPEQCREMGERGRARIEATYRTDRRVEEIDGILRAAAGRH